ncbi:MAG: molybdopterin biosynthesis protein [Halobacteriales archaeon]|nr:molybdopterin biosynthesis protein [Halobacteriales archaeon]
MRKEFRDLASLEEAASVAEQLTPERRVENVPLVDARGRVLAESVESPIDVPGFYRSLMDGYAVRARDTYGADETEPANLEIVGTVSAGTSPDVTVGDGEAAEIATGAPIPDGADAVVPVERTATSEDSDTVHVRTSLAPSDSVMFAGSDVAEGERALSAGTTLSQREIGLAAALGAETLPVYAPPRVGIVSTGDELVRPGGTLDEGQIHDVNTFSVAVAVEDAGGEAVVYDHVGDDYEEMLRVMREAAADCDLVLSSGSTSASDEDVVYRVVEEEGELLLHGVALKPGRPTVFGRLDGTAFVGLPGNPISALSVFRVFVAGMVRDATGKEREAERRTTRARVADEVRTEGGRTRILPVGLVEDGGGSVLAYSVDKGSGATTSLTLADGYVTVEPSTNYLDAGDEVEVSLFGGASPPALLGGGESDGLLGSALEGRDARWLSVGSVEGTRRLRNGILDVAAVGLPPDEIDELGVSDASLVRGYDRRVGYAYASDASPGNAEVFGVLPEGYALRARFDEDRDDADMRVFRSEEGAVNAVTAGRVDAALVGKDTAVRTDLSFKPTGWSPVDLLVADDRREKEGVVSFLDAVDELSERRGYRVPDDAGGVLERWD